MASINGICKNCGSLVVAYDRDEMCECLFCDCVFPISEAVEIAKNPGNYTFPNEPQPKREGNKRYTTVPVFPDPVPAAIKQAESLTTTKKKEKNPYEVSADDVKAPAKTVWTIAGISLGIILLVVAIFLPMHLIRQGRKDAISESVGQIFTTAGYAVNTASTDGYPVGYSITGSSNNVLQVVTSANELSEDQVRDTYEAFAALRAEKSGYKTDNASQYYGDVRVEIIAGSEKYIIRTDKQTEKSTVTVIPLASELT